jgi:hypothetical protein
MPANSSDELLRSTVVCDGLCREAKAALGLFSTMTAKSDVIDDDGAVATVVEEPDALIHNNVDNLQVTCR